MALPPQENPLSAAYRPDIDGLRAIAISLVVIFHAFPGLLPGGFLGVDVFFVISGYLISGIVFGRLRQGNFSFIDFYARRIRRIFPALLVVLVFSLLLGWVALLPEELAQLGKHVAASAGFGQNFMLRAEAGYFDTATELKPLMHLWSLAIEEQFYLLYPALVVLLWRTGKRLPFLLLALVVGSFVLSVQLGEGAAKGFFEPQVRFWELLIGGLLAWWHQPDDDPAPRDVLPGYANLLAWAGMVLLGASALGYFPGRSFSGWWSLLPVAGASLLIVAGEKAWFNRVILASSPAVFIGLISYPLYLWHWPLLAFGRVVEAGNLGVGLRLLAIGLSLLLAWLTYRLIERPVRFGPMRVWKIWMLLSGMVITGAAGYLVFHKEGLTDRAVIREIAQKNAQFAWNGLDENGDCKNTYPEFTPGHCIRSRPAPPTILLLGDSHSNHLYPGLAKRAEESGEVLLNIAGGGCLPFFDTESVQRGFADLCGDFTNRALGFAERSASAHTLVFSFRGVAYVTAVGYGNGQHEPELDWRLKFRPAPELTSHEAIFETSMRRTFERLEKTGKRLVFVFDVAELGFDPKSCIDARPIRLTAHIRQPCAVPRQDFEARTGKYRALIKRILYDFPKIEFFDASALFCDQDWCWAMHDDRVYYRDDDHLSIAGSVRVAEKLWPLIVAPEARGLAR